MQFLSYLQWVLKKIPLNVKIFAIGLTIALCSFLFDERLHFAITLFIGSIIMFAAAFKSFLKDVGLSFEDYEKEKQYVFNTLKQPEESVRTNRK